MEFISPTQIANVMLNDHFVDWIRLCNKSSDYSPSEFLQFLFNQGNSFEEKLVSKIAVKIPVVFVATRLQSKSFLVKTIEEMKKGTPIIWSAPLISETKNIRGLADLLIRSDYINKLIPNTLTPEEENHGCLLSDTYHYRVIDIKFSTLPLRSDGIHLLNQDRYKAYKAQVWLYTQMVGEIQGYYPNTAYIMGRGYNYTSNGVTFKGTHAFDKFGVVDFENVDNDIPLKSIQAINWLRNLYKDGKNWSLQTHPELYPNMKTDVCLYEKNPIANDLGEITQLWQCGVEQRELALEKGIRSWKDPRFTAELVGFQGNKALTLNRILEVNRCEEKLLLPEKIILPEKYRSLPGQKEYFVDFEVFTGIFDDFTTLPLSNSVNMIFMISISWMEKSEMVCTTFYIDKIDLAEEARIMKLFMKFVEENKITHLYHWSEAEPIQWQTALKRQNISEDILKDKWIDLLQLFKEIPIAIKGCFSYSLKDVVKSLNSLGFIRSKWESKTTNGSDAMLQAFNEFQKGLVLINSEVLRDIVEYNQTDCTSLCEILKFLRRY